MSDLSAALYQRWITEVWNGDLDQAEARAAGLVTEDFVGHWPGRPALVRGASELAGVVRAGRLPFDPIRFEIEIGPIATGDLVAARWVGRGKYRGGAYAPPGATAASGTPVEFRGHDILRVADDKLAEYWVISEEAELMSQLAAPAR